MSARELDDDVPKLDVKGLGLVLDGKRILQDIDLQVREGETVCVLGPSGSGKSMLLRCLTRLTEHTSGTIMLGGRSITDMPPTDLRRSVSLVQQAAAMLEGTVLDNLAYGPRLLGLPEEEVTRRVDRALADASLDESFLGRRAERLSGGERQRVAIARSLVMGPAVLLLDEPTAALDPRTRRAVEETVMRLIVDGDMTMVIVTHDVDQSRRLGHRTILLREGRVVASGDSGTLLDELDPEERGRYMGELERWEQEHEEVRDCE